MFKSTCIFCTCVVFCLLPNFTRAEDFPAYPVHDQPSWVSEGLVFAGNWEPLRWRYRKGWSYWGPVHVDEKALYEREHREENVLALKKFGVNAILSHGYKGYGLKTEAPDIEDAAHLSKLLHKHGMRIGSYISCLFMYESLFQEEPDARNWTRINYDGSLQSYGNQGYRYRVYLQHPDAKAYIKKAIKMAIEVIDTDIIFLDTVAQTADNFHPLAEKRFRAFLKNKYPSPDEVFTRLGLDNVQGVKIPYYPNFNAFDGMDNPVAQEWVDYRCQEQADWFQEMAAYARSLKPDVAVCSNSKGVRTFNTYWKMNIDFPRYVRHGDLIVDEPGDRRYAASGKLITQIPTLKTARRLGLPVFNYTDQHINQDPRLLLAEAMAFNQACLGHVGTPFVHERYPANAKKYIDFFWKHIDAYRSDPVAPEVALLRSWPNIAYYNRAPFQSLSAAQQSLLASHTLFDILFDQDMRDLDRYRVLVLTNQECLSDAHCQRIEQFVADGGGLVFTGSSGRLNEIRRLRTTNGLSKLLGGEGSSTNAKTTIQRKHEKGRVVYIPSLTHKDAALPEAVRWAAGGSLNLHVEAPPFAAVEYCRNLESDELLLHVVNYNYRKVPTLPEVSVRLSLPEGKRCQEVVADSPDGPGEAGLSYDQQGASLSFDIPDIKIYSLIRIRCN